MTDYIKTKTKDGTTILIEVEATAHGSTGFGRQTSSTETVSDAYAQTLNTIRACANGMVDTLQNLDALPSSASINFAIKVDGKAGAMIAKSTNEAQFKVSLSWKQDKPEDEGNDEKEQ